MARAEDVVSHAAALVKAGERTHLAALDEVPAPVYLTDPDGRITFFNRACTDFAGRTPQLGSDRWCVTWRLYTEEGAFLPHEECPMAVALRSGQRVRDVGAIAERPDGTRRSFLPFPTPLHAECRLVGGVNLLIDVTHSREAASLELKAAKYRRLARSIADRQAEAALLALAYQYEQRAAELRAGAENA